MEYLKTCLLAGFAFSFAITTAFAWKPEYTQLITFRVKAYQDAGCYPLTIAPPQDCSLSGAGVCTVTGPTFPISGEVWYNIDGSGCDYQYRRRY